MRRDRDPLLTLPDRTGVLYFRLYQKMRTLILDGSWSPGMRIPSSRRLAADLRISRNTAMLALDQLIADGWIESRQRSGMFVSRNPLAGDRRDPARRPDAPASRPPVPFELSPGAIDAFPVERWATLQSKLWSSRARNLLYDNDRAGDFGLRTAIADFVAPSRGMRIAPEQIVIVTGLQEALDLTASVLSGREAVVEDPAHQPSHAVLAARGMRVLRAPVDADGLDVSAARKIARDPALIVVGSALQFPTCVTLSEERRRQVRDWVANSDTWVFDDDYDSHDRFDGLPAPVPLREQIPGKVITNVSLNRLLYRSLRLGFMVVPDQLVDRMLAHRQATDDFINLPNQAVLRRFIETGAFAAHLRRCRDLHEQRREALIDVLQPYLGTVFEADLNIAGLHLILRPTAASAADIEAAFRSAGIFCFTLAQLSRLPNPPEGVLLGFAAYSPDVIRGSRPAIDRALQGFS